MYNSIPFMYSCTLTQSHAMRCSLAATTVDYIHPYTVGFILQVGRGVLILIALISSGDFFVMDVCVCVCVCGSVNCFMRGLRFSPRSIVALSRFISSRTLYGQQRPIIHGHACGCVRVSFWKTKGRAKNRRINNFWLWWIFCPMHSIYSVRYSCRFLGRFASSYVRDAFACLTRRKNSIFFFISLGIPGVAQSFAFNSSPVVERAMILSESDSHHFDGIFHQYRDRQSKYLPSLDSLE